MKLDMVHAPDPKREYSSVKAARWLGTSASVVVSQIRNGRLIGWKPDHRTAWQVNGQSLLDAWLRARRHRYDSSRWAGDPRREVSQPGVAVPLTPLETAREIVEMLESESKDSVYLLPAPGLRVADWIAGEITRGPADWIPLRFYWYRLQRDTVDALERQIETSLRQWSEGQRPSPRKPLFDGRPRKGESFSAKEVADYLATSARTVTTLIELGELEALTVGKRRRIARVSLVRFLRRLSRGRIDYHCFPHRLLTVRQAADLLGVSPAFIRSQIANGKLRRVVIPSRSLRISTTELQAFLETCARRERRQVPANIVEEMVGRAG